MIGVAATAAALVLAAPRAVAEPGTYTLSLAGSTHAVGCTYELSLDNPPALASSATFFDNGAQIGQSSGSALLPVSVPLQTQWTPATPGTHKLTATVSYLSSAILVTPLIVEVAADGTCAGGGLSSILPSISG
ncbi:hypothetical protein [Nocardia sp. NPDC050406]|uniref:hypothetical protein n=1 Tax=Nocardia sp. NPDC050406 TaxID=3364318 RepID=UPI0037A4BB2F